MKGVITTRIRKENIDYLDNLVEMNSVSRSKGLDILLDIVKDYFEDWQLKEEFKVRDVPDERKKVQG